MVAGLIMELILANPSLLEKTGSRCHQVKDCLKSALASQLAGLIPLASFHRLAQGLDRWFEFLYPFIARAGIQKNRFTPRISSPSPGKCLLQEDLFVACLEKSPGLLPRRRHRKLSRDKLRRFLENTGGDWFRLLDFVEYFTVDRKTAWEYVHKLLQAGLLMHNQAHSTRCGIVWLLPFSRGQGCRRRTMVGRTLRPMSASRIGVFFIKFKEP